MPRSRELNTAYLERKLRAIGLVGSSPLQDLADIQGLLVLEVDRPEWRAAGGEYLWTIARTQAAAGAGTFAYVGVRLSTVASVISVVTRIAVANATAVAQSLAIGLGQTIAPVADGLVFPRDARNLQEIPSTRRDQGTPAAALGFNELKRIAVPPNTTLDLPVEYLLAADLQPGGDGPGIYVQDLLGNVGITVTLEGYERSLEGRFEMK